MDDWVVYLRPEEAEALARDLLAWADAHPEDAVDVTFEQDQDGHVTWVFTPRGPDQPWPR
jgi:hypothetical protein